MALEPFVTGKASRKTGSDDDDDDISDEEKWLDALEKGNLNSYGEIGKKDPALLTARQVRKHLISLCLIDS